MRQFLAFVTVLALLGPVTAQPKDRPPHETTLIGHDKQVSSIVLAPDGKLLLSISGADHLVQAWDLPSGKAHDWDKSKEVVAVAISPDGKTVAVRRKDNSIRFHEQSTGKELKVPTALKERGSIVGFSPDGKLLAVRDGLWSAALVRLSDGSDAGRFMHAAKEGEDGLRQVVFSPDGKDLYCLCAGVEAAGFIAVWNIESGKLIHTFVPKMSIGRMAMAPDGRTLAIGDSFNRNIILLDAANRLKVLATLETSNAHCRGLAFSADSKTLATLSTDQGIDSPVIARLWDVANAKMLRSWQVSSKQTAGEVLFTADGKTLITGGYADGIHLWDIGNKRK